MQTTSIIGITIVENIILYLFFDWLRVKIDKKIAEKERKWWEENIKPLEEQFKKEYNIK